MAIRERNGVGRVRRLLPPLFDAGDAICRAMPVWERRLDPEHMLQAAQRRLPAWDDDIATALHALVASLEHEASLNLFGRVSARWDISRLLANLMGMHQEESRDPSIRAEPITRPVFITGLPRSGTSFLHNLLAEDPDTLVPRCWQIIYPYPRPRRADRRARDVQRMLDTFGAFAPELSGIHPLQAESAQECTDI